MSDQAIVHIGENSPEEVAYRLFRGIAESEGKGINLHREVVADRQWLLDTYSECLFAVRNARRPAHRQ